MRVWEWSVGVLSSAGGSLPFCPLAPVSLVAVSQLGLTRRRRMRPKPFGAISCIPDGASPAPTLASTSLPRHCTGNAASSVRYSRHNACRARHAHLPIAHVAWLSGCLSADHSREREESQRDTSLPSPTYITPPIPPPSSCSSKTADRISPPLHSTHDSPLHVPPTASSL